MSEKDRSQRINPSFLNESISRREAIKRIGAMGAVGGIVFGGFGGLQISNYLESRRNNDPYIDIDEYRLGHPMISLSKKERLLSLIQANRVELNAVKSSDGEFNGQIYAQEKAPHILMVYGVPDPSTSLNLLELKINDKNIIVPIVQSEEYAQTCIYLGELESETDFSIKQLDVQFPHKSDNYNLTLIPYSLTADPFTMGVIKNIPELYVRKDNEEDSKITNDIPLAFDVEIGEGWTNTWLVGYTAIMSAEDGGSSPYPLIDRVGRLTDNETFAFTKQTESGMILEEAYQGRSHKVYIVNQYYDRPKMTDGTRLQYAIDTDNNMVAKGNGTNRAFSYFPDILQVKLGYLDWEQHEERGKAMQIISIRENIRQGYLKSDDSYVRWFIKKELGGKDLITPFTQFADVQS